MSLDEFEGLRYPTELVIDYTDGVIHDDKSRIIDAWLELDANLYVPNKSVLLDDADDQEILAVAQSLPFSRPNAMMRQLFDLLGRNGFGILGPRQVGRLIDTSCQLIEIDAEQGQGISRKAAQTHAARLFSTWLGEFAAQTIDNDPNPQYKNWMIQEANLRRLAYAVLHFRTERGAVPTKPPRRFRDLKFAANYAEAVKQLEP